MKSLQGHLLIASPRMDDPRFDRTVILMLKHDETGAVGIILNRPMRENAKGPWQIIDILASRDDRCIQVGGPVAGPLIVLHGNHSGLSNSRRGSDGDENQESNVPPSGVFVIQEPEQLQALLEQTSQPLQFFVGHAGWQSGQLENEIDAGAWITTPAVPDFVFGHHEDMWIAALKQTERCFYSDVLGITGFPADVTWN